MATTYELKICGQVQHVGFRDRIEDIGRGLGIDGVVYNYKDETVRILANFDDEELKEFFKRSIKFLEKKDNLIKIKEIEEKELNAFIEFPKGINRISADDLLELNKKLDEGVKYIKMIFGVLEEVKKGQDTIIKGQDTIIKGQDTIIKGQDTIINGQEEIKEILKDIRDELKNRN
ncbi:acylphosphatase [Methanococcus aeolicus]|uniref:acylphosphatase n=1 Tax=Methanococcus aeolicus TaxID=42879 RepID=UPI0021CABE51|nr:acylphosphatase [Methanococcus aeolicus]UXM84244.1 acylphosphatase [Methanococcus aeolicus]